MSAASDVDPATQALLPAGYVLRPLQREDYDRGYLALLSQLTVVGVIERTVFIERCDYFALHSDTYYAMVIEDVKAGRVVAAGTVFLERKFIRQCGIVAHIEDIVVDASQRGLKFGLRIISALLYIARNRTAYKTILNCADENIGFYEKCGFSRKEVEMILYTSNTSVDSS